MAAPGRCASRATPTSPGPPDIERAPAQSHAHAPAVAGCSVCHDAHGGSFPAQLQATVNTVCVACHVEARIEAGAIEPRALFRGAAADDLDRLIATAPH